MLSVSSKNGYSQSYCHRSAEVELIEIKVEHGQLMFHQSGGCDGSSPMCYPKGEFMTGDSDVLLGEIADCQFFMGKQQFEYWKHTQLIIDVVRSRWDVFH